MKISEGIWTRFSTCLTKNISLHPVLIICLVLMWTVLQVDGSVFHVTNSLDNNKGLTLRMAIAKANSAGGSNTIILTNEIYNLTLAGVDENSAHTGDLDITKGKLTIIGVFKTNVIVDATMFGDRVFQVLPAAQLTLSNLVITGGSAPNGTNGSSGGIGENGGGIYNAGTLTLYACVVAGNTSGSGGSALTFPGTGGNGGNGGGIYNAGTLSLHNSMVSNNFSGSGGDGEELEGNAGSNQQGGNAGRWRRNLQRRNADFGQLHCQWEYEQYGRAPGWRWW